MNALFRVYVVQKCQICLIISIGVNKFALILLAVIVLLCESYDRNDYSKRSMLKVNNIGNFTSKLLFYCY